MRIYLAGPMTGHPDLNFPMFHAEAAELRAAGHEVINPAELNPDHTMPWATCMRRDIAALVTCDGIALLPGWRNSKGATLEHHIAERLELTVMHPRKMNDAAMVYLKHAKEPVPSPILAGAIGADPEADDMTLMLAYPLQLKHIHCWRDGAKVLWAHGPGGDATSSVDAEDGPDVLAVTRRFVDAEAGQVLRAGLAVAVPK